MNKKLFLLVIICLFTLTGCFKKDIPYMEKFDNVKYSKSNSILESGVYFYSVDENNVETKFDDIRFVDNKMKYEYSNFKVSKPDKNGNVKLSFDCKLSTDVEFYTSHKGKWYYSYSYTSPGVFDYYTGEIYRSNQTNVGAANNLMKNGIETEGKDKPKYTKIVFNKKETKIGVLEKFNMGEWQDAEKLGVENGEAHYKVPSECIVTTEITMPENYDGVVIMLNKEGTTEESYNKSKEDYNKLVELQQKAKEEGKKSKELIELEKKNDIVHKIVDPEDEERKDKKIEDYYYIRVSDIIYKNKTSK